MKNLNKYLTIPKISYSEIKNASTKDKMYLFATVLALIFIFGGLFLGLLTGTPAESENAITPNPYFIIFFTGGFALAGIIIILITWRTEIWIMSISGSVLFVMGAMATIPTVGIIFSLRFIPYSGNTRLDALLYSCLALLVLCISLEISRYLSKFMHNKK